MYHVLIACFGIFLYLSGQTLVAYCFSRDHKVLKTALFTFFSAIYAVLFCFYTNEYFSPEFMRTRVTPIHDVVSFAVFYFYMITVRNYSGMQSKWLERVIKFNLVLLSVMGAAALYCMVTKNSLIVTPDQPGDPNFLPFGFLAGFKFTSFASIIYALSRISLLTGLGILIASHRINRDPFMLAGILVSFSFMALSFYFINFRPDLFVPLLPIMNIIEIARFNFIVLRNNKIELARYKERALSFDKDLSKHHRLVQIGHDTAAIIHDLANPAQVIAFRLSLISRKADTLSKECILAEIEKMRETNAKLMGILQQSKQRYLKGDMVSELKLADITQGALDLTEHRIETNHIEVKNQVDQNLAVKADFVRLLHVVTNIVNNACDEIINDEHPWISLSSKVTDKKCYLSISNSGEKIDAEIAEKIFTPFFSTKEGDGGSGFGLSICREYLHDMDAEIEVNLEGEHTQFDIIFDASKVLTSVA